MLCNTISCFWLKNAIFSRERVYPERNLHLSNKLQFILKYVFNIFLFFLNYFIVIFSVVCFRNDSIDKLCVLMKISKTSLELFEFLSFLSNINYPVLSHLELTFLNLSCLWTFGVSKVTGYFYFASCQERNKKHLS